MFDLVIFDNDEMSIYHSSKVRKLQSREVIVTHKGSSRYKAKLLCSSENQTLLETLKNDITNKTLRIAIPMDSEMSSLDKGHEEDPVTNEKKVDSYVEEKQSVRKRLFDRNLNDDAWGLDPTPLNTNDEIIEQIKEGKGEIIEQIKEGKGDAEKTGSGSEWLSDSDVEQEQWDALLENKNEEVEEISGKIRILENILVQPGTSTSYVQEPNTQAKRRAKKHCCLFCKKMVINIPRHMRAAHILEKKVQDAIEKSNEFSAESRKKQSKFQGHTAFEELRKLGDLKYNQENRLGDVISVRNSPTPSQTTFVSCPLCAGYYSRKNFKVHFRSCHMRIDKEDIASNIKNIIGEARVHGQPVNKKASPELIKYFFPYFTKPAQANILFRDDTAVEYANKLITKYYKTNAGGKHHIHIASQLRLLADIFINAKKVNRSLTKVSELIHPQQYDIIIEAIQLRCGYMNGIFKSPTTANNCCTLLLKLTRFLKCEAIKRMDAMAEKQYTKFEYLLVNSQNQDITRQALDNKTKYQREKKEILPSTQEINILLNVLQTEMSTAYNQALHHFTKETYTALCKALLAYLLAFNRKRPGDVEKTQKLEYLGMAKIDPEYLLQMPDNDKKHAEEFARYITQGKLNKKASNLIPYMAKEAIDLLLKRRSKVGISNENPYVFARIGSGAKRVPYFKADEALRQICERNNLQYNKLNANKLRKHLATCTAMLSPSVQNVISDFMGHTMAVHKNVYQQKEAHTDIVVMGKVLLQASGLIQKEDTAPSTDMFTNTECLTKDGKEDGAQDVDSSLIDTCLPGTSKTYGGLEKHEVGEKKIGKRLHFVCEKSDENYSSTDIKKFKSLRTIIPRPRRTWQTPEKTKIRQIFRQYLTELEVPSIHDVQQILLNEGSTVNRSVANVRSWIFAEIDRIKKQRRGIDVQRWTTPERKKIREHFKSYFDVYRNTFNRTYPTNEELNMAAETVPEFKNKNARLIRSKIQHEFNNIEKIIEDKLQEETSCSSSSGSYQFCFDFVSVYLT